MAVRGAIIKQGHLMPYPTTCLSSQPNSAITFAVQQCQNLRNPECHNLPHPSFRHHPKACFTVSLQTFFNTPPPFLQFRTHWCSLGIHIDEKLMHSHRILLSCAMFSSSWPNMTLYNHHCFPLHNHHTHQNFELWLKNLPPKLINS
jgi:hypothetical protein